MDLSNLHYHCDYCNKDLGRVGIDTYMKIFTARKEKGKQGYFCNKECCEKYKKKFEIICKNTIMYKISDDEYVPYIDCHYYFKAAEDCYQRMCHKDLAILP